MARAAFPASWLAASARAPARARQRAAHEVAERELAVAKATHGIANRFQLVQLEARELEQLLRRMAERGVAQVTFGVAQLARHVAQLVEELAVEALELAAAHFGIAAFGQRTLALPGGLQLDQARQVAVLVGARHLLHHFRA